MFVNARTDAHLAGLVAPEQLLWETLHWAHRYLKVGTDGLFIPGVSDVETITAPVKSIDGPLNVMAGAHPLQYGAARRTRSGAGEPSRGCC